MKYTKLFATDSLRIEYEDSENYIEPYVSYVIENNTVHYNKPKFFCKLVLNDGSVVNLEGSGELTEAMVSIPYQLTLVSAEIGELCTGIGERSFCDCSGLTSVTIPDSVSVIGISAFESCIGLTSVTIPEGVTSIYDLAFHDCSGLTSMTIPEGVTSISNDVFSGCSGLTSVTIPSSVEKIGDYAFDGCTGLTSVMIIATTPPELSSYEPFSNTNNCPIYVPVESVEAYKSATNWSSLASRIQAIPSN